MLDLQRYRHDGDQRHRDLFFWHTVFPVAWWRQVNELGSLILTVRGSGRIRMMGKKFGDDPVQVAVANLTTDSEPWEYRCDPCGFDWLWVEATETGAITELRWSISQAVTLPQVTVVVPTFNRETDAYTQAKRFLENDLVGHVVVVDQARTLHTHNNFEQLRRTYPEKLVFIQQANLGGSGGYARGMAESLRWPKDAVLNSDDDALLPPESLRRMLVAQALAAQAGRSVIMGTAMLSAEAPTQVVSAAEWVNLRNFMWGPADGLTQMVDIAQQQEQALSVFEMQHQPNYSGWWGTLLPPGAVAKLGLPAPYFIKWDDAEYGLRATQQNFEVLTLPGVGVWHPTWGATSTVGSWMSLPLHRNRLATAAAYGASRRVIRDSLVHQVKHILSLQYAAAELWSAGIEQMRKGPETWLGKDLQQVRPQAQKIVNESGPYPPTSTGSATSGERKRSTQRPVRMETLSAVTGLIRPLRKTPLNVREVPAGHLNWRDGLGADVVILTDGDGQPTGELRRRPGYALGLLVRTIYQHASLALGWGSLQRRYRRALEHVITTDYWAGQFEATAKDDT